MFENTICVDLDLCRKPELTKNGFPKKNGVYWRRLVEKSNGSVVSDWRICEIAMQWVRVEGYQNRKLKRCLTDMGSDRRRIDMPVFNKRFRIEFRTIPIPCD